MPEIEMKLSDLEPMARKKINQWARREGVSAEEMARQALEQYVRLALSVPEAIPEKSDSHI
ncbi:hypothetical protein ACQ5SP_06665 [Rhodovulum sp. YNF3179]|uniref:hypothetical protein n=1 Tax=Rhodovulum sp. YNF3179 TaxID=3425127 RepID=UPI003D3358C6